MNRLFLGFLVAGTALGGSAFKNVESHTTPINSQAIAEGYFVQKDPGTYTYVSTTTHEQGSCYEASDRPCSYYVPATNSVPAAGPYSESQLISFGLNSPDNGDYLWLEP